jgi:hypothetical protein
MADYMADAAPESFAESDPWPAPDELIREQEQWGTDHCEIGMKLATQGCLPMVLKAAIRCHHEPSRADPVFSTLVRVIQLGDWIARMADSDGGFTGARRPGTEARIDGLDLNWKDLVEVGEQVVDGFQTTERLLYGEDPYCAVKAKG